MRFNTTPNILTLVRIGFVPLVVGALMQRTIRWDIAASILFGIAAITDYFDGYIARVQKSVTVYGKLMDPLADKFLVVSSLIFLQALDRVHPITVTLLICREIAITGLRALASAEGVVIAASPSAKWKTATQMVAIPFLMVKPGILGIPLFWIGDKLLYVSLAISLWSAQDYVMDFFKGLKIERARKIAKKKLQRESRKSDRMSSKKFRPKQI